MTKTVLFGSVTWRFPAEGDLRASLKAKQNVTHSLALFSPEKENESGDERGGGGGAQLTQKEPHGDSVSLSLFFCLGFLTPLTKWCID